MTAAAPVASKEQLISEFNAVVAETERLLRSVANSSCEGGGEIADGLRESAEEQLVIAKDHLRALRQTATDKTLAAARATDEYVHENPWQSLGMVAGVSLVLGALLGALVARR